MLDTIKDLWEVIINSNNLINSVTMLSMIITVVIFVYQEYKAINVHNKEEIRLKDEIVNLIIRNEVNNNLLIGSVDQLDVILEGFELLKDSKFRYNSEEIVKIAYAKVYESEYINQKERKAVLKRLEDYLNEYDINRSYYNEEMINDNFNNTSVRLFSIINILIFSICMYIGLSIYINPKVYDLVKSIILAVAIILPVFVSNYIFRVINLICKKVVVIYKLSKVKNIDERFLKKSKSENDTSDVNNYLSVKSESYKEVKFENLFTSNKEYIVGIAEQRIILEELIKLIYKQNIKEGNDTTFRYNPIEIMGILSKLDILNSKLINRVRTFYKMSSEVIHGGHLEQNERNNMDEKELLDAMKDVASQLYIMIENKKI